jgi:hypothetical protein
MLPRPRSSGTRALDRDVVIAGVDFDQHGTGVDLLVVANRDAHDGAADAGRDLHDVRVDLRVVGRLATAGHDEPGARGGGADEDDQHGETKTSAAQKRASGFWQFVGHVSVRLQEVEE